MTIRIVRISSRYSSLRSQSGFSREGVWYVHHSKSSVFLFDFLSEKKYINECCPNERVLPTKEDYLLLIAVCFNNQSESSSTKRRGTFEETSPVVKMGEGVWSPRFVACDGGIKVTGRLVSRLTDTRLSPEERRRNVGIGRVPGHVIGTFCFTCCRFGEGSMQSYSKQCRDGPRLLLLWRQGPP